jgi:hypothetical protein
MKFASLEQWAGQGWRPARDRREAPSRASIPAVPASKPQMFEQDVQTSAHRINKSQQQFV